MKWNLATMNNLPEVETAYKYKNHKGVWQYGAAGKGALLSLVAIVKGEVDIFWLDESPLPSNEDELELWREVVEMFYKKNHEKPSPEWLRAYYGITRKMQRPQTT